MRIRNISLRVVSLLVLTFVFVVATAVFTLFDIRMQTQNMEDSLAEEADEAACGIGRSVVVGRRCRLGPARRLQGLLGEHILAGLIKVVGPHPQGVAHALAHAPREAEGRHLVGIAFGRGGSQHDGQP